MYFYFYHALLEQSKLHWLDKYLLYIVTVSISWTGSIWSVKFHWVDKFLLYTVTDQNIVFLVPDSCRVPVRNYNSIKRWLQIGHHQNTIRMTLVSALFRQFGIFNIAGWIQYTYIVRKYKIYLHVLRNRTDKIAKGSVFLSVSKAHTNKFYIFRQCTYIVYI
jgi:hypothetical protein